MIRKFYLTIILGILVIAVSYLLFFFIYKSISQGKLKTINGKSNFDITAILGISKDRITLESETYNKKEFIEYDCVIDSTYFVTIIRSGKMANTGLINYLYFENQPILSRNGWFNYDIVSPAPYPLEGLIMSHFTYYNVFLLPLKNINKISVFANGKIINEEYINNSIISYFIKSSSITVSFNNQNKGDLIFLYPKVKETMIFSIFFTIDKDRNLYIGCVSTDTATPKTLKNILFFR